MKIETTINSRVRQNISKPLIKKTLVQTGLFFDKDKRKVEVAVVLLGDKEIAELNKNYRGKNKTTNVLSFCAQEGENLKNRQGDLGDIFICLPEAKREAKKYGLSLEQELARLLTHGFLHLLGYDHVKEREAREMEKIEKKILFSISR